MVITWGWCSATRYLLHVTEAHAGVCAYTQGRTHICTILTLNCLETRPILLHSLKVAIISLISLSPKRWPFAIFCQKTRYRPFTLNNLKIKIAESNDYTLTHTHPEAAHAFCSCWKAGVLHRRNNESLGLLRIKSFYYMSCA